VHALHYTEIAEAADLLMGLMIEDAESVEPWEPLTVEPPAERDEPAIKTLHAAPVHDAIRVGDDVLALRDGRPIRMQGIGATIWTSAAGGIPDADVRARVEQAHGRHPDADRLVAAAIDEMLRQGVLARA
jgi:hypothetical protein